MASGSVRHDPRGVDGQWSRYQRHWFADPAPDLAWFVAHYWAVRWNYRDQPPYRQLVVPYPNMHLSFIDGVAARVHGVARRYVIRELTGAGRVLGVAFRPGCFRPLLQQPASSITDRSVRATELLGPGVPEVAVAEAADEPAMAEVVERFLRSIAPPRDRTAEEVAEIVELVAATPDLTRVDDLAVRVGISVRRLQRRFADYVGVGPKLVIRRYRLHEVTERLARGRAVDWARLAADLGYADQAHLTRDFTAMVGEPPTAYAERYPP